MAGQVRIRPACPGDAQAAAALLRDGIRRLCRADHGDDPEKVAAWCANKTPEAVAAWIADPGQHLLVAEADGGLIGVAAFRRDGRVTLNYVAPAARFRGVSTALLARIETDLAGLGLAEARLDSTRTALIFYRARGWRQTAALTGDPSRGIPMQKRLT